MQIEKSERSKRVIVASRENEKSYDRNFKMAAMPIYGKNHSIDFFSRRGWSGGAMVLGKLPVPGRPTIWITVGQGPTALAVGAGPTALAVGAGGGGCLDIFTLIYPFSALSAFLWGTARYRRKYCLKGPLNPKQPTNQNLFQNNQADMADILHEANGATLFIY